MSGAGRGLIAAAGICVLLGSCRIGPSVETYTAARNPEGVRIDARTRGEHILGEVIEVRGDTALVVLAGGQLILVPWQLMRNVRITGLALSSMTGKCVAPDYRAAVTRLSRFPQGMTPEIRARFLAHLGQSEIR